MLICFVRHGQTDDNLRGIIQGQLDTPLNDHGRKESRRLERYLSRVPFDRAYTSSLSRAKETAEIVLRSRDRVPLVLDAGLMERRLGSLQGRRRLPGEKLPNDVESSADFRQRVAAWLRSFLSTSSPDGTVLVLSHGAFLAALLAILLSPPFSFTPSPGLDTRRHCLNTSIMRVKCWKEGKEEKWVGEVLTWGQVDHLDGMWEKVGVADDVR